MHRNTMMIAIGLLTLVATSGVSAQSQPVDPPIFGSRLMTTEERDLYRERMRAAQTAEERDRIRLEHHQSMRERARAQGIALPDEPPARGEGYGFGRNDNPPGVGKGAPPPRPYPGK